MDWIEIFKEKKALLNGHFQLSSGNHSQDYFQCALVLQYPDIAKNIAEDLAQKILIDVEVVVSPAMGGIIIGHEVARALNTRAIFTEREDGEMKLRRGFSLKKGERALVVEDVLTTGKSSREVIKVVQEAGAQVVGLASVVNRSVGNVNFAVPTYSLVELPLAIYDSANCPLCKQGLNLIKPGSRKIK
ncbi:MAG: orotate phosphoribosyltransferase [bacterium]